MTQLHPSIISAGVVPLSGREMMGFKPKSLSCRNNYGSIKREHDSEVLTLVLIVTKLLKINIAKRTTFGFGLREGLKNSGIFH